MQTMRRLALALNKRMDRAPVVPIVNACRKLSWRLQRKPDFRRRWEPHPGFNVAAVAPIPVVGIPIVLVETIAPVERHVLVLDAQEARADRRREKDRVVKWVAPVLTASVDPTVVAPRASQRFCSFSCSLPTWRLV